MSDFTEFFMESFYFTLFGNIRKKWLYMAAQCTCTLIVCSKSIKKKKKKGRGRGVGGGIRISYVLTGPLLVILEQVGL